MYSGDFTTANTIYHLFGTTDNNNPAVSVAVAGLSVGDIQIYKDGSTTQRSSTSGYTLLDTDGIDFDGIVGIGGFSIDLSDNTDAGFYAAGSEYIVVISGVTVDSGAINFVACSFSIERAGGVLAVLAAGISGEIRNNTLIERLKQIEAAIEHQYPSHTGQPINEILFVDPVNGDTHANGNRGGITDPYLTIQDCHDNAVTDSNHDVIYLLSGAAAGVTTHTVAATTTISKRYTFIRGPGRDFVITRTGNGNTIEVTADGVEISGVQIGTSGTGSGRGIQLTDADFLLVKDCWINDTQGDGINITRGENCQIQDNTFTDTGQSGAGDGIDIVGTAGSSDNNVICRNVFRDCAGDAIQINGGTTNNTTIRDNFIEGSAGYGIDIQSSSVDSVVADNRLGNNTLGDINDLGITTVLYNNSDSDAPIATIQTQIGTAGDGLTDLGGMSIGMKAEINTEADTALTDYDPPTNAEMEARTPTAAQLAYIVANAATGVPVTFTTLGGSPTTAVFDLVDSGAANTTDDQYNGRLLVFTDGALKGVVTDITDYAGSTTTATITAIPASPTAAHNARLI